MQDVREFSSRTFFFLRHTGAVRNTTMLQPPPTPTRPRRPAAAPCPSAGQGLLPVKAGRAGPPSVPPAPKEKTPGWRESLRRYAAHLRQHPVRSLLRWAVFLVFLDIFRYLALPPVLPLMAWDPGETAMMALRREAFTEAHPGKTWRPRQQWVPLERISPWLRQAVVASEDDRFYTHHGFDLELLWQAALRNWKKGRLSAGASTITQQLAKNLWFSPERSLLRKIKEAIMTARLELWLDKDRILELYLNVVEWGQGIFGAEAAARHYFGKPAAALNKREAAQLAVMLPAPLKRSPHSPLVQRLSSRLMRRMY